MSWCPQSFVAPFCNGVLKELGCDNNSSSGFYLLVKTLPYSAVFCIASVLPAVSSHEKWQKTLCERCSKAALSHLCAPGQRLLEEDKIVILSVVRSNKLADEAHPDSTCQILLWSIQNHLAWYNNGNVCSDDLNSPGRSGVMVTAAVVKDTATGQTGIWTCASQAEGSNSHKYVVYEL